MVTAAVVLQICIVSLFATRFVDAESVVAAAKLAVVALAHDSAFGIEDWAVRVIAVAAPALRHTQERERERGIKLFQPRKKGVTMKLLLIRWKRRFRSTRSGVWACVCGSRYIRMVLACLSKELPHVSRACRGGLGAIFVVSEFEMATTVAVGIYLLFCRVSYKSGHKTGVQPQKCEATSLH